MDAMLSRGLAKGRWAVLGMVTVVYTFSQKITFLRKSQGLMKKHSYFMQAVHFTVDCPQLSWKKPGNFSLTIWDL